MDRVVSQLLAELDGVGAGGEVFVIAATNRPDLLDSSLLRPGRFDRLVYLGVSSEPEAQMKVLSALTRKFAMSDDVDLLQVVGDCPTNFTGADFYALASTALAGAIHRKTQGVTDEARRRNEEDIYGEAETTHGAAGAERDEQGRTQSGGDDGGFPHGKAGRRRVGEPGRAGALRKPSRAIQHAGDRSETVTSSDC